MAIGFDPNSFSNAFDITFLETFEAIWTAIKDRVASNWTASPIKWPGRVFPNSPRVQHLEPRVKFNSVSQATLGQNGINRIEGELSATIFAPMGNGDGLAYKHTDVLRALFPRGLVISVNDRPLEFGTPGAVFLVEDTMWLQILVTCPFYYDEPQP